MNAKQIRTWYNICIVFPRTASVNEVDRKQSGKKTGKHQDATAANKREPPTGDEQSSRAAAAAAAAASKYIYKLTHTYYVQSTPLDSLYNFSSVNIEDFFLSRLYIFYFCTYHCCLTFIL